MRCGCGSIGPRQTGSFRVAPPGAVAAAELLRRVDVAGWTADALERCRTTRPIGAGTARPGCGRDGAGGVVRRRARAAGRLLLAIHHLAVDGVSWRILLPDLQAAWAAIRRGSQPALPDARHLVPALGGAARGGGAGPGAGRRAAVLARHAGAGRRCGCHDGALDPGRDVPAQRGRAQPDPAAGGDRRAADPGAGGLPCAASTTCC